ncbi:MAG: glycosyltransferase, partial [Planctomycetes bacterium]|nr:glycosyltransferase [Planctomycetota bacterium]
MANVKRILIVLPDLGMSGAVFAALNLVPDFLTAGCAVMVTALADGERAGLFTAAGAKVEVRPALAGLFAWPWARGAALEAARSFKPDVVHAMSTESVAVGARLARACAVPLAVTVNRLDKNQALAALPRGVPWGLIALSDAIQEQLAIGQRIPRERSVIIPNGLNLRWFPRPQDGLRDTIKMRRVPVVGTYGTLADEGPARLPASGGLRPRPRARRRVSRHGPRPRQGAVARARGKNKNFQAPHLFRQHHHRQPQHHQHRHRRGADQARGLWPFGLASDGHRGA